MHLSPPALHPPVIESPEHKAAVEKEVASLLTKRPRSGKPVDPSSPSIEIPLTTVSWQSNFDALITIGFPGSELLVPMIVDTGQSMLIIPYWEDIEPLGGYKVLMESSKGITEPWGCPANVVQGPIQLTATNGGVLTLENCIFYACTGLGPNNTSRTADFGAGRPNPWCANGWSAPAAGIQMLAPLAYCPDYPVTEFNFAAAENIFAEGSAPTVAEGSSLVLYKTPPKDYNMFDVIKHKTWMSLIPKALSIGETLTSWPGAVSNPIAMIDTGGGPAFLSDPNGYVWKTQWPNKVKNPSWTETPPPPSLHCHTTLDVIGIVLGDESNTYYYSIDASALPASARKWGLVMCELNQYMEGQQGMNIGGLSALENYILIDYANARVGLKPKPKSIS